MRITTIIVLIFTLVSCNKSPYEGYSLTESEMSFKLEKIGDGQTFPKEGNYVTIAYQIKGKSNELIRKSRTMFRMKSIEADAGVVEAISMLRQGDSMSFYIPTVEFYKHFMQEAIPAQLKGLNNVKVGFKLDNLQTEEEFLDNRKKFMDWLVTNDKEESEFVKEQKLIDEHAKQIWEDFTVSPTGLYYSVIEDGKGDCADYGQSVIIHYEGFTFDSLKFDSSRDRNSWFEFILGNEMQVIKGIEEGLFLMKEGSKYQFLIPSYLAFGDKGTINGSVPPNTPVMYEVELIRKN